MGSPEPREWLFYDQYLIKKHIGWPCWMATAVFVAVSGNILPRWMPTWVATLILMSASIGALLACGIRRTLRRASKQG
jgi:hypothetical protein